MSAETKYDQWALLREKTKKKQISFSWGIHLRSNSSLYPSLINATEQERL
jgi:hypothetical protein